jgi:Gamma tubulin complex component N-terminal
MLHELLLALFGTTGGLIIEQSATDNDPGCFLVNPKLLGLLSPAEAELINRIVTLGHWYKRIQRFLDKYGGISTRLALQLAYSGGAQDGGGAMMGQGQ